MTPVDCRTFSEGQQGQKHTALGLIGLAINGMAQFVILPVGIGENALFNLI